MPINGYFDVVFAKDGDVTPVPDGVQSDGSVSYDQGYGADYSLDPTSNPDALLIERAKFNQLLFDMTTAIQNWQQNSFAPFITSTMNGGSPYSYPAYIMVLYDPGSGLQLYQSLIPNNTDLPTVASSWAAIPLGLQSFTTGDMKPTFKASADPGWVLMMDGNIGNAASGGTARANADCAALFSLLWTNVSNTYCPVSGGRGGSAASDFAANKTIQLPQVAGRVVGGAGAGSGLTARSLGQTVGEENHVLTVQELAAHNHTINDPDHFHAGSALCGASDPGAPFDQAPGHATSNCDFNGGPFTSNTSTDSQPTNITINNTGNNNGHNTMQPTMFSNWMIKL